MTMVFVSRARRFKAETTSRDEAASSPDVGSSRTKTLGRAATEQAIVTRRFCVRWTKLGQQPRWRPALPGYCAHLSTRDSALNRRPDPVVRYILQPKRAKRVIDMLLDVGRALRQTESSGVGYRLPHGEHADECIVLLNEGESIASRERGGSIKEDLW